MDDDDFEEDREPEPEEGDWKTDDHVNFYQDERLVLTLQVQERPGSRDKRDAKEGEVSDSAMWRQIDAKMKEQKFFPNVWFISDHGNAHLMSRPKRVRRHRATPYEKLQGEVDSCPNKLKEIQRVVRAISHAAQAGKISSGEQDFLKAKLNMRVSVARSR